MVRRYYRVLLLSGLLSHIPCRFAWVIVTYVKVSQLTRLAAEVGLITTGRKKMPTEIQGETYYKTSEAARLAGISRSTLLRWLDNGVINEAPRRDRRGWRLFAGVEIETIRKEAQKLQGDGLA